MVSERELTDLQTRVERLRDDRTRMMVEHQEAIAERDREIAALKDRCGRCGSKGTVESTIYCADCLEWYRGEWSQHSPCAQESVLTEQLAERDRLLKQIADVGYMRRCECAGCIEIRAALAGKGVSR